MLALRLYTAHNSAALGVPMTSRRATALQVLATPFVVLAFALYLGGMALGGLLLPADTRPR